MAPRIHAMPLFTGSATRLKAGSLTLLRRVAWYPFHARKLPANGIPRVVEMNGHRWYPSPWQKLAVGDLLWVQEPHRFAVKGANKGVPSSAAIFHADDPSHSGPWRQPFDLPQPLSRFTLEITALRTELLQQIPDDEIVAEGIAPASASPGAKRAAYRAYWDSVDPAPMQWADNPPVIVVNLKVHPCNVRKLAA